MAQLKYLSIACCVLLMLFGGLTIFFAIKVLINHTSTTSLFVFIGIDNVLLILNIILVFAQKK